MDFQLRNERWNRRWNRCAEAGVGLEDCGQVLRTLPEEEEDNEEEEEEEAGDEDKSKRRKKKGPTYEVAARG